MRLFSRMAFRHIVGFIGMLALTAVSAFAQGAGSGELLRKQASATRLSSGTIRVDGRLDEQAWSQAASITDFIQKEPEEGVAPSEEMDVRVLYDDGAIYIGARMSNLSQMPIQAPMGRRDAVEDQAEFILVSLDTFLDRRTAYAFGVTATGVRIDRYYPLDDEATFDEGFDPVWDARTTMTGEGWTAELWIPFSQLRFTERQEQVWGLNILRSIPTKDELDYWAPVRRTDKGWASRFGDLRGIVGVRPTRRLELLPYVAGNANVSGTRDLRNPFDDGRNLAGRVGADLRMGVGPNLTLEATVNPDFGQVEADPAEVNLTAFETFFTEKRPFFLEGARLLNLSDVNNFFYSRRIGAPPSGQASGDYVDYPETSTIAAAGKLTGRLASGTSVGVLSALTNEESARVFDRTSSSTTSVRVAPRTAYGLVRVQQEFGPSASTASAMVTMVHRDLRPGEPLASLLSRNAFAVAGDATLRFKGGEYELRSYLGATNVDGDAAAISRIQRSSTHYFQRPDRTYSRFNPNLTSLAGYKTGGTIERTGGDHWLWNVDTDVESPGFETNDMGRLTSGDGIMVNGSLRYRETVPGALFRNYSIGVSQNNEFTFSSERRGGNARANLTLVFLNFWTATLASGPNLSFQDVRLTRGGPLMKSPRGWTTTATLRNRATAQTAWNGTLIRTADELGGGVFHMNGGVSFRPGPRWQFSVNPAYIRETEPQQYVATLSGGRPETYDRRYVFSYIDRSTVSAQFRMGFTLKPDVNVDVYAEPFAASGRYYDFGELPEPRASRLRSYGTSGTEISTLPDGSRVVTDGGSAFTLRNEDFNVRSFRSNVVLRWEWRPGSTLFLVWQQNRRASEMFGDRVGITDMFRSLTEPGSNFFAVKTSFWLPIR